MINKTIITDCDGVLLDWEYAFSVWMEDRGHKTVDGAQFMYNIGERYGLTKAEGKRFIKQFNESAAIGFLPALRDAVYYVKMLHEKHGFTFECVTSLSTDKHAQKLRERNLEKVFGKNVFTKVKCLPTGADKDDYLLKHYGDSGLVWIEDKPENAGAGDKVGMKSILVEHGHNMDYSGPATVVKNWEEIYNLVTADL